MPVPLVDYLEEHYREPQPAWLDLACPEPDPVTRRVIIEGFLRSRIVYYPGAGKDGRPVRLFNSAHAAHAYIYAVHGISRRNITPDNVRTWRGFRGYRIVAILDLEHRDPTAAPEHSQSPLWGWDAPERPGSSLAEERYAALYVLERLPEYDAAHGARRFAVLVVLADAFAAYYALFCRHGAIARPFCVVYEEAGILGGELEPLRRGRAALEAQRMRGRVAGTAAGGHRKQPAMAGI